MQCFIDNHLSPQCLEAIVETIAEGLILLDTNGTIKYCNEAMTEMTGKTKQYIVGEKCCSLMSTICEPPPSCTLFKDASITNRECTVIHTSGKTVPVLKNAKVLRNSDGTVIGAIETFTDISILRTAENRLQILENHIKKIEGFGKIVGKSHRMLELYNMIELAAASNTSVLITGETGTGKELVAQSIHENSARSSKPMVKLNCSALPESLLESELFGHAKGSFTGAIKDKTGRFEIADGSTLFLDEIGELSPLIQVKLLRFLQEKEFERVGENITRKSDVRIITATHRELRKMVADGIFREDLYYRLKVFPLHIPPLRERKEDIGALIDHFIAKFNLETGKSIKGLTHDSAITMMDYCWPGNIRELENAIEHAFVTCKDELIDIFDLPLEIRKVELRKGICTTGNDPDITPSMRGTPEPPPFHLQRAHKLSDTDFKSIYDECRGNQSEIARRLGVDRTTVWRRVKRMTNI
jgi:two-component system, NtrC family, response regulator HydG